LWLVAYVTATGHRPQTIGHRPQTIGCVAKPQNHKTTSFLWSMSATYVQFDINHTAQFACCLKYDKTIIANNDHIILVYFQ